MIAIANGWSGDDDELLSLSERSRVVRRFLPGGSIVWKQALEPGAAKRARHEVAMLERLSGVAGIVKLSAGTREAGSIGLEDERGVPLAEVLRGERLSISALLTLALQLTQTIASMHRLGIVHRDVNPSNILLVGPERRPVLIDFDIASSFAEERPAFATKVEIEGTLAYIAPEQTGRTGRVMDQRADMYALGATLYELASGRTPFGNEDSFQVIRDHLVRVAISPWILNPAVTEAFSDIIMRLLEKEPDRRYQSAEGLEADLSELVERRARGEYGPFALGERDFPQRLLPPSRLIGREAEIAELNAAFTGALEGRGSGLLVAGAPGVGKSALINELRAVATTNGGWFVAGKFDRYRQDLDSDAVRRGFRSLFRLLLAEPEEELVTLRAQLVKALGSYAAYQAAVVPELGVLLNIAPEAARDEQRGAEGQLAQNGLAVLRCIASPARPVVFVVDDLQWAPAAALGFIDAIITSPCVPGLLVVAAYRSAEVGASHPLAAMISRWNRSGVSPRAVLLDNLKPSDLIGLLQEMLRLAPVQARELAAAVGSRTAGNPYDTVELVNGLRQDGALTPGAGGWNWDEGTIRRYVAQGDVVSRLSARIDALGIQTRALLEIMACLGGEVKSALLHEAAGVSALTLEEHLMPALEDGLIVLEHGSGTAVRFRHDRIQQAAYGRLDEARRLELHLALARRLALLPDCANIAAEQYFAAVTLLREPAECRNVIALFRGAAEQALVIANYVNAERFTALAATLVPRAGLRGSAVMSALENERHAALYNVGRLEDADAVYAAIALRCSEPLQLVDATCVQISSLTNRNKPREAVALGLELLAQLGLAVPERDALDAVVADRLDAIYRWCEDEAAQCVGQPVAADEPSIVGIAKLLRRLMPPAFFSDGTILAWLVIESIRLWSEYGPRATLVGAISHGAHVTVAMRDDYRTGYRLLRRILAISEERGYEPATSMSRFLFALCAQYWFEPVADSVAQAHAAFDGLVQGGDLQNACFTFYASGPLLFQHAATLEEYAVEVEASLAFSLRTGNHQVGDSFRPWQQLVRTLCAKSVRADGFNDGTFNEATHLASLAGNPMGQMYFHTSRAYLALLFGDPEELLRQVDAAMPLMPFVIGTPITALAYVLHALAYAGQLRDAPPQRRAAVLAALDVSYAWVRGRADDTPVNVPHVLKLIEAERAWGLADFATASAAFEAGLVEVREQRSPRHQAFMAERAGLFYLEYGLERYGRILLDDARRLYESWGATAKVRLLETVHPFLSTTDRFTERAFAPTTVSSDAMDMVGILRASQALSSQTSLRQLKARVVELLAGLTGATSVLLVIRRDDSDDWLVSPGGDEDVPISIKDPGAGKLLPLAALRYVQRTREPLLLVDATRDDRFARDPYVAACDRCSLLVVPILSQGELRAVVLLENRLGSGAFSTNRLDAVMLIAGQLAVSLDNSLLYASLEQKVADRTEALAAANRQLAVLSMTDGLTGLVNRRGFDDCLEVEWQRALRSGTSIGLAMIDIDEFKKYNDSYGHVAGDACLRRVAKALKDGLRPGSDVAARYGGEEFVLILPDTGIGGTTSTAERLRASVAALREQHVSAAHGIVTISIGVIAFVPMAGERAGSYLEAADAALYEAKRDGRNRVATAG